MADKPIMTDVEIKNQMEKFADPQHFTGENNEGRARTGEKNPLPTNDKDLEARLNSIEEKLDSVIDVENSAIRNQLAGSIVEELATNFYEDIVISRTGTLDLGVFETIYEDYGQETVLQSLAVGTDYKNISIYIEAREGGSWSQKIGIASPNGNVYTPSPMNLNSHSGGTNDFFRSQVYDDKNNKFVVTMMRPMTFSNGFRLRLQNQNSTNDHTVSVSALISKKR